MADYAVELRNVWKRFPGPAGEVVTAVRNVTLQIFDGEFFSLLGPSGCGKTTSLRMIAGFELPTEGEIYLHNRPMGRTPPFQRPVNTVFQSYALFPHMTIGENVAFGLQMDRVPKREIAHRVKEALDMVRLPGYEHRRVRQLSGGQQQRVALARALVKRPEVLLLDEPLGALDLKLRKEMQLELKRLQREVGITFVYVTHDQEEALTMSDRIAVMSGGEALQVGDANEIYERPNCRFVADFIGETNFLDGQLALQNGRLATVALPGGLQVHAETETPLEPGAAVSVAVRPEKVNLGVREGADNQFSGCVESVVYIGTDTHYDMRLPGEQRLRVREQNHLPGSRPLAQEGDSVTVNFSADAARVLTE
ncbi:MAG: spermidine/putrescine ABC transporter ATP-binding protein [Chloroflexi bacterium]|nr:MAG: spermidine/putrescine ABC transporter ATP-binding protein [Chloroflexota bacterium]